MFKPGRTSFVEKELLRIIVIICVVLLAGHVSANERSDWPTLKVASFSIPPLLHNSESGEFSGTVGETILEVCDNAKINCEVQVVPLKRAYQLLKKGGVDALITLNFGQFKDCCVASDWDTPWSAGIFSNYPLAYTPKGEEDVYGRHLLVVNGMRSPYLFLPNLDKLAKEDKIKLSKAPDIKTAVSMFLRGRAPYLWGSDDFKWYMERLGNDKPIWFTPLVTKPIVLWVRKQSQAMLDKLNASFKQMKEDGVLGKDNLLNPDLMERQYKDAPFNS